MTRALELAAQAGRAAAPNPLVGAVIVRNGEILAEGYHTKYGAPHAEVEAFKALGNAPLNGNESLYVTLEPCSHFGKTPPCVDAILRSGIRHVVVGCRDPFPEVSGNGIEKLRAHGIQVEEDLLRSECVFLNRRFFIRHIQKRPYIILKWAQTSDGYIARKDGTSKWISNEASRKLTHSWRAHESSILVGSRTALIDDPELTVRHVSGENPIRLLLDRGNIVPSHAQILNECAPTLHFSSYEESNSHPTTARYEQIRVRSDQSPITAICTELYSRGVLSVMIEGGSELLRQFIIAGLWDEARVFICPLLFGEGLHAPTLSTPPSRETLLAGDVLHWFVNPNLLNLLGCVSPIEDPLTPLTS